jgi:hypothetical protein
VSGQEKDPKKSKVNNTTIIFFDKRTTLQSFVHMLQVKIIKQWSMDYQKETMVNAV